MPEDQPLAREIDAPLLTLYGIGTILGAGIYVLIGKIAGQAGYWAPLAFLVAAVVAAVTGLVYAELATRSPSAGGPTDYVDAAFAKTWFTIAIGWMIVATGVVSAATITNGFAGYVQHFVDVPKSAVMIATLGVLGGVAAVGVKESAWFMAITTVLGTLGLLFVMYVGYFAPGEEALADASAYLAAADELGSLATITGVMTAAFLAVYSFIGFEDLVHMAEEVKKPKRAMPIAIVVSLITATVLYVGVSLAALRVVEPELLAGSEAPLIEVIERAGFPAWPLAVLSLWMILNGALAQIVMAARVIYSLGDRGGAPAAIATINERTSTPLVATLLGTATAIALALFFPLQTLAAITSFIMLAIFAASNVALIVLARREREAPFRVPRWLPWIGVVTCVGMVIASLFIDGG